MIHWEYRYKRAGDIVSIQRVKGLMDTDIFAFRCTVVEFKEWVRKYEANNGRGNPIFVADPYLSTFVRVVPMIRP